MYVLLLNDINFLTLAFCLDDANEFYEECDESCEQEEIGSAKPILPSGKISVQPYYNISHYNTDFSITWR